MSQWCQDHWDRLRAKIEERGLNHLIAPSGVIAAEQAKSQLETEEVSPANFDPLMSAFWAIESNAMSIMSGAGVSPLYMLAPPGTPEDPVEGYGAEYEGRTWPRCPLCYLGLAHEVSCTDDRCTLPKVDGYAWMLDRAADDAKA